MNDTFNPAVEFLRPEEREQWFVFRQVAERLCQLSVLGASISLKGDYHAPIEPATVCPGNARPRHPR